MEKNPNLSVIILTSEGFIICLKVNEILKCTLMRKILRNYLALGYVAPWLKFGA